MKKNELRIGNYISDIHAKGNYFWVIRSLSEGMCVYGEYLFESEYKDLRALALRPSMMESFGFFYCKHHHNIDHPFGPKFRDMGLWVREFEQGVLWFAGFEDLWDGIYLIMDFNVVEIKHVHHLQNLYFDLTGIELTFKEYGNEAKTK